MVWGYLEPVRSDRETYVYPQLIDVTDCEDINVSIIRNSNPQIGAVRLIKHIAGVPGPVVGEFTGHGLYDQNNLSQFYGNLNYNPTNTIQVELRASGGTSGVVEVDLDCTMF